MSGRRSSREDAIRLADILAAMERIDRYRAGLDDSDEGESELVRDAILYNLVVIGEAVNALSEDVTAKAPQIPWRDVVGLRNFLAHEYFDIDPELIAQVINVQLHELRDVVIALLGELRGRPA
jgi:uncharacterized protein with HEPN domain